MESAGANRREGLLTAVEGDLPALAVGDAAARHVRLEAHGITYVLHGSPSAFIPWADVRRIVVEPQTTWFPNPGLADSVMPVIEGLLGGIDAAGEETPTFPVRITSATGETREWRATTHYLAGYRKRDAQAAARLIDYLVERPAARVLLGSPVELLDRFAVIARTPPPPTADGGEG